MSDWQRRLLDKFKDLTRRVAHLERLEGATAVVWLDTPLSSTQAVAQADFLMTTFGIPDEVRFVIGAASVIYSGSEYNDTLFLSAVDAVTAVLIANGHVSYYDSGYAATGVQFLPLRRAGEVRLTASLESIPTGTFSITLRVYGYVP